MRSRRVRLSDIADLTVGYVGNMAKQYTDGGVKFLRSLNIKPFRIVEDDLKYISEDFNKNLGKSILHENDLIIVRTGVPGTCCVVPKEYENCNCADVVLVRPDLEMVNPHYLAAFINVWGKKQVENNKVGAIQKHFNVRSAEEMLIELPDLEEQNKIAKIVCDLNEKISKNEKINDYLEQQCMTKYAYDFLQSSTPEYSIGDIADMYQPKTISGNELVSDGKFFVYGANGIIGKYNNYNHEKHEIAIACRGASCGSVVMTLPKSWITGNAMIVTPKESFPYKEFIYYSLRYKNPEYLMTGSAQPQITRENLSFYTLPKSSSTVIEEFELYASHRRLMIINNSHENQQLAQLRDWLLPMLMNGQATIKD